jgi:hypothetical protein
LFLKRHPRLHRAQKQKSCYPWVTALELWLAPTVSIDSLSVCIRSVSINRQAGDCRPHISEKSRLVPSGVRRYGGLLIVSSPSGRRNPFKRFWFIGEPRQKLADGLKRLRVGKLAISYRIVKYRKRKASCSLVYSRNAAGSCTGCVHAARWNPRALPSCPVTQARSTWHLSFRIQVVTSREQQQNMHSRSHSRTSSLPLSGSEAPQKWIPRRVIRVLRSPRRIATWVVGSLVIVLLVRIVHQRPAAVGTTVCEFVSPVEGTYR